MLSNSASFPDFQVLCRNTSAGYNLAMNDCETTTFPGMELRVWQGRKYQGPSDKKKKTQTAIFKECEIGKLSRRLGTCAGSS